VPCRAGITTRPHERRVERLRNYPTMHNWEVFGPFDSREEAEAWEEQQRRCGWSGPDEEVDVTGAKWWGYHFDY
jgi:hypothetical protein